MSAVNRAKTHCRCGHALSGDNLVRSQLENAGIRNCRICWNQNARARRRRNSKLKICPRCRGPLVRRTGGWKICLTCAALRKKAAELIAAGKMPSLETVLKVVAEVRAKYVPLMKAARQKSQIEDQVRAVPRSH